MKAASFVTVVSVLLAGSCWTIARPARGRGAATHAHGPSGVDPETPCGPVSLAVLSQYFKRPTTIEEYRALTDSGELGVCSFEDLSKALRHKGLAVAAVRYDPRRPPEHRLPMILFVDGDHFLSALPRDSGCVIVDPPAEPKAARWSELAGRWQGEAIVVGLTQADLDAALKD